MTTIAKPASSEVCDLAMMVAESSWQAKDYLASKRAARLALEESDGRDVDALSRLGRIALVEGDYLRAAEYFERVLDETQSAAAAVNLAIARSAMKEFVAAGGYCGLALKYDPRFLPAYIHAAAILEEQGKLYAAEQTVLAALDLFPGNSDLVYALALYQLKRGDFENGWANYEQRPPRLELAAKLDEYPEWQGETLAGKTVLVCGEQGLGDQIMFARYVPLLVELGATVVLFTLPMLARLLAASFAGVRILASDAELAGLEPDYWVALGSLPLRWREFESVDVVGTPTAGTLNLPYLFPPRRELDRFASLVGRGDRLKVGLCWKGNPKHRRDEYRSMRFADMAPLLDLEGVDFYSLQLGDTESGLTNLTAYSHDLADTAAAIAALDLVITVDTAMLHLAGAIGVPVWGLIYTPGDWRWGAGSHCQASWYQSARLYRQREQLDWRGAILDVASDLARHVVRPRVSAAIVKRAEPRLRGCRYGAMTWPTNDHYIGRALDLYGEYSQSEADLLRKVLKPGEVVIEAGANVGGLTVAIGDMVGTKGTVYAFEPQPAYFRCLLTNTDPSVQIHAVNTALGRELGQIELRAVETEKVHAPGWPSPGETFTARQYRIDGLRLPTCALIKVDVDGPEHEILLGAEETIDRCRPLIYVEYDKPAEYPEMLAWLHAKGYRLYRHAAPLFNPRNFRDNPVNVFGSIVSLMVLAVPNERKDLHPVDWGLERIQLA